MSGPFDLPWDKPPQHVNELGVKFWLNEDDTRYARKKDIAGTSLPTAVVFWVEKPDGYRTRLLTIDGEYVAENQSMEGMATRIDMHKAAKRFDEKPKQAKAARTVRPRL